MVHAGPVAVVHTARDHLWYGGKRLPVVDRNGGQGRVLLPAVEGVGWRQALAFVLGGRVVGQGLVVAGSHVLRLECGQGYCFPGF